MKNLIKYLEENSLESLTDNLGISVKEYPEEGLYVLNYSQIDSPKTHPVVMECRGLIIDKDYNPVCRPFDRFFNMGEALEITGKFNFNTSVAYEKVDGSLVKVYKWKGIWRVATRGTAFAESENYTGKTFENLILKAFGVQSIDEFSEKMNKTAIDGYTYIFEYISPDNRVVTPYKKDEMVLLGIRINNISGAEYSNIETWAEFFKNVNLNVRTPKVYHFNNNEHVKEFVNSLSDLNEGVVCKDFGSGVRIKVKSDVYVAVHKLRGDCLPTPKKIMNLVVTNETDEYLSYFPEERERFTPYEAAFVKLRNEVECIFNKFNVIEDQKEFALSVKDYCYQWVLFMARKSGKLPLACLDSSDVNKRVKLLAQYVEEQ